MWGPLKPSLGVRVPGSLAWPWLHSWDFSGTPPLLSCSCSPWLAVDVASPHPVSLFPRLPASLGGKIASRSSLEGGPRPCLLSFSLLRPPEPGLARWFNVPRQERPLNSAFFPLRIPVFSKMLSKFYMTLSALGCF